MVDIEFFGEKFDASQPSEWTLMEFADAADSTDENSIQALVVIMRMLHDVISDEDWPRFQKTARANRAGVEDCMRVVVAVIEGAAARPISRPSDSSDGPQVIEPNSVVDSSSQAVVTAPAEESPASQVISRMERVGRPDLALVVQQARDFSVSA